MKKRKNEKNEKNEVVQDKSFYFYIVQSYFEEHSGMFASKQSLKKRLCVDVSEKEVKVREYSVQLSENSHDCNGYGIFDDRRYRSDLNDADVDKKRVKNESVVKLIALLRKNNIRYDEERDEIRYGCDGAKEEYEERGQYYGWHRQISAVGLAKVIEREIKSLAKKEKAEDLQYHI